MSVSIPCGTVASKSVQLNHTSVALQHGGSWRQTTALKQGQHKRFPAALRLSGCRVRQAPAKKQLAIWVPRPADTVEAAAHAVPLNL